MEEGPDDAETFEHLEAADRALDRMEELIADVLTLARQGQPIDETEPVRLSDICEAAWEVIDADDSTLSIGSDVAFMADPERLRQLLENLFRNSVEHGGEDVTATVGDLDDGEGFYVADDGPGNPDDGPGNPEEDREDVFEYGYSTATDGTGFGLATVSEIAEAHDWRVSVTDAAGGGARFEERGIRTVDAGSVEFDPIDAGSANTD